MNVQEINTIVESLNEEIETLNPESEHLFTFESSGYYHLIKFNEYVLWNSEDSDRQWIESKKEYEPFLPFIKRQFNKYIKETNKLIFFDVEDQLKLTALHYQDELNQIEQLPQTQDSLTAQLGILRAFANKLGLYDAVDYISK